MKITDDNVIILIPSKGRYNAKKSTMKLLADCKVPYTVLVEPHEFALYTDQNKINIGEVGKGLPFVRQFAINYAKGLKKDWLVMIDDDIEYFGLVSESRVKKDTAEVVLNKALNSFNKFKKPLNALQYAQLGWSAKELTENRFCDVVVMLYLPKITQQYDPKADLKSDRDFALQVITKGGGTLRNNWCVFGCPKMGSNAGGLYDDYKKKKDEIDSLYMAKKYPRLVEVYDKNGTKDIKVNWKLLK